MRKLGSLINNFIQQNQNFVVHEWEKRRKSVSFWHNGPIDDAMLQSLPGLVEGALSEQSSLNGQDKRTPPESVDFIVNSGGGSIEVAYQAITLLDRKFPKLDINFVVPRMAKSAATLMALGSDKILFSQTGEIGPLDVQIYRDGSWISGITVKTLMDDLKANKASDSMKEWIYRTLKLEDILEMERWNKVAAAYIEKVLPKRMFKNNVANPKIASIVDTLCLKLPNHAFVVDHDFAKGLGLAVNYVTLEEDALLQRMLDMWDCQAELIAASGLGQENKIIKDLMNRWVDGY